MRLFPLLFIAVTSSICFAADEPDYDPLATGCEWIMDATITGPDGTLKTGIARRVVENEETRNGKAYFRTVTTVERPLPPLSEVKLSRKDQTGFYSLDPKSKDAKEQTELLFPYKVGLTWKKFSSGMTLTDTVIGFESVTINGKKYDNCVHLRSTTDDGSYTEDYWNAPGLGSIKSDMRYSNGAKISLALREFKPGKK